MRAPLPLLIATLAAATPAAASLEEARALLDAAAPRHCEVLMMQMKVRSLAAGTVEREQAAAAAARRAQEVERELAPQMARFDAARASLTAPLRDELQAHGRRLLDECATRAYAAHGMQLPVDTERPRGPVAVDSRRPGPRQKSTAAPEAAALQKQTPAP